MSKRISLDTKLTSTPQRSPRDSVSSPSISVISNGSLSSRTSSVESSSLESMLTGSEREYEYSDDYNAYFEGIKRKIEYYGKLWNSDQPESYDRIYYYVIKEPHNAENIAREIISKYKSDPKPATKCLLQFFVDVCGLRQIQVDELFDFESRDLKLLMKNMALVDVSLPKHIVFERNTKLAEFVRNGIFNFLQKLVRVAYQENVIFTDVFSYNLFNFLQTFSFNTMYVVRLTGVFISARLLSDLVCIYAKMRTDVSTKKDRMLDYIEHLYMICSKNSALNVKRWKFVLTHIVREMRLWIKYCPETFFNRFNCLLLMQKYLKNLNSIVRRAAFDTCEKLLVSDDLNVRTKKILLKHIAQEVQLRILDIDIDVSIRALRIMLLIARMQRNLLMIRYVEAILSFIIHKNSSLAKEAARFLITWIRSKNNSPEQVLLKIAECCRHPKFTNLVSIVVESYYDCVKELQSWVSYVKILQDRSINVERKEIVLEMAYNAAYQTITGQPLKRRAKYKVVEYIEATHVSIGRAFIPSMSYLVRYCESYPKMVINIINIIMLIDSTDNFTNCFCKIYDTLQELFLISVNEDLLEKIVDLFYHFNESRRLQQIFVDKIRCLIQDQVEEFTANPVQSKTYNTLRISKLFYKFDLTLNLTWQEIFETWDAGQEDIEHLIVACKWFLIWKLKYITAKVKIDGKDPDVDIFINELKIMSDSYIEKCIQILDKKAGHYVAFKAFASLSQICIMFKKDLLTMVKMYSYIGTLQIIIKANNQDEVINFVQEYVIQNSDLPLLERQEYFTNAIELIFCISISEIYLPRLYAVYNTHYTEFGEIIAEAVLKLHSEKDVYNYCILKTLTLEYEKILDKYEQYDPLLVEAKTLRALADRFISLKALKFNIYFFDVGLNYVFMSTRNTEFLYVLLDFVGRLDKAERTTLRKLVINRATNKNLMKNDCVLKFASIVKKLGGPVKKLSLLKKRVRKPNDKKNKTSPTLKKKKVDKGKKRNRSSEFSLEQKIVKKPDIVNDTTEPSSDMSIHDTESDDMDTSKPSN